MRFFRDRLGQRIIISAGSGSYPVPSLLRLHNRYIELFKFYMLSCLDVSVKVIDHHIHHSCFIFSSVSKQFYKPR